MWDVFYNINFIIVDYVIVIIYIWVVIVDYFVMFNIWNVRVVIVFFVCRGGYLKYIVRGNLLCFCFVICCGFVIES